MLKKDTERAKITTTDDQKAPGRVKQICQDFLVHSDSGFAYRLQKEEFAAHFDRNRTHRHESRLGIKTARGVEEEEKQILASKQKLFVHSLAEKELISSTTLQENDTASQSHSNYPSTSNDQNYYEEFDQLSNKDDTSCDEQLAKLLQEEEEELALASRYHSHFNSTNV